VLILSCRYTGDVNLWYPPKQQKAIKERVAQSKARLYEIAKSCCRLLTPGDEQPVRPLE